MQEALIGMRERLRMALREGRKFRDVLAEIDRTQWLEPSEFSELQRERVVGVIHYASRFVPFYQELFARNGWESGDFNSLEDVKRIPIITKQDVLRDPDKFVSRQKNGPRHHISTSGTTGTPLSLTENLSAIVRENAFIWRHYAWAGFERGQRRVWLRGDMIVPIEQHSQPFWRYNRPANTLMMSSYHISAQSANSYLDVIEAFDPHLVLAYPSSIGVLANIMEGQHRRYRGKNLRSIITSSEMLTQTQRTNIEGRFQCRLFDHYGSSERVAIIGTCEAGNYHVEPDYSYVEFEDCGDGTRAIIGTGFNNFAMPLIRYAVGDRIVGDVKDTKCECGRYMPRVDSIEGRLDDYVLTRDGRHIGRLDHIFKGVQNVVEAQIRQDRIGEVLILVTPASAFSPDDARRIVTNAEERIGGGTEISLEIVHAIPRGPNGKFLAVVRNANVQ